MMLPCLAGLLFSLTPEYLIIRKSIHLHLVIIVFSLLTLSCTQQKTAQEHYESGKALASNKDFDVARLAFKNALSIDPALHRARYELGTTYYLTGDFESARFYFESARENGLEVSNFVLLLASTYLKQNDMSALQALLDKQEALSSSPTEKIQLALYDILLLARTEELELAESRYSKLIDIEGNAAQGCALCLFSKAQLQSYRSPTDAIESLDKLVDRDPDYSSAYLSRGQLYFALRNANQAFADFKKYESLQPENVYIKFLIAVTALQLKDMLTATTYVETLLAANPQQPFLNHLQALLAFEREDYGLASESAGKAILHGLSLPANYMVAGVSAYQQKNYEIAYRHLNKAKLYYPDNTQLRRLLALLEFKFGNLQAAGRDFVKTDVQSVKDALFGNLIAYQLVKDEQFEAAEGVVAFVQNKSVYQPIVNLQSKVLNIHVTQKKSLSLSGDQSSSTVIDSNQDSNLISIILLIETQALEQAKTEGQAWLKRAPDNIDAINILAHTYQLLTDTAAASDLFEKALTLDPTNVPSLLYKARLAESNDQPQRANQLYRKALSTYPQNLAALRGLLTLTFSAQQRPVWSELLQPISIEKLTDDHLVAIADAMYLWQDYEAVNYHLNQYQEQAQWSELIWMVWLKNSYHINSEDRFLDNVDSYLEQNVELGHSLFALSILESQKNFELLVSVIKRLPESHKETDSINLQYALSLVELKRFEEANERLVNIDVMEANQAAQWYIKGLLKQYEGDLTQASSYFSAYYQLDPNFHSMNSFVTSLTQTKRTDEAIVVANDYLKANPSDTQARLTLALKLASIQPKAAIALLESKSVRWFLLRNWKLSYNVAWLYASQNQPETALRYSENALLLNPDNERVKTLYARILGRLDSAMPQG